MSNQSRKRPHEENYRPNAAEVAPTTNLDSDTLDCLTRMNDAFRTLPAPEVAAMAATVLEAINGQEVDVAVDQRTFTVLLKLMAHAQLRNLEALLKSFSRNIGKTMKDVNASGVMQLCCEEIVRKLESEKKSLQDYPVIMTTLERITKYTTNNLDKLFEFHHSTHCVRALVECIATTRVTVFVSRNSKDNKKSKMESWKSYTFPEIGADQRKMLTMLCECLPRCNLAEYLYQGYFSVLLQVLIVILSGNHMFPVLSQLADDIIQVPLDEGEEATEQSSRLNILCQTNSTSPIVERLFEAADNSLFKQLYRQIKPHFKSLSYHYCGNFVIQSILSNSKEEKIFKKVADITCDSLDEILAAENFGVLVKLVSGCQKFPALQSNIWQKMMHTFAGNEEQCFPLCAYLVTGDMLESPDLKLNYHGSMLLQALLKWSNVKPLINSFCSSSEQFLLKFCTNVYTCYVVEEIISSENVSNKLKSNVFKKLLPHISTLACDRAGCRIVEKLFHCVDMKKRREMMEALMPNENKLCDSAFGFMIINKLHLKHFKNRRADWDAMHDPARATKSNQHIVKPQTKSTEKSKTLKKKSQIST